MAFVVMATHARGMTPIISGRLLERVGPLLPKKIARCRHRSSRPWASPNAVRGLPRAATKSELPSPRGDHYVHLADFRSHLDAD